MGATQGWQVMKLPVAALLLAIATVATLCAANSAGTTALLRVFKPMEAINQNAHSMATFKYDFIAEAADALGVPADRFAIETVRSGDAIDDEMPVFGSRRRMGTKPYKGGTIIVEVKISEGNPTQENIFKNMQEMVEDLNSKWYQGVVTSDTDPGVVPTDIQMQSTEGHTKGAMPSGIIFPVGFTPLGVMIAFFILMVIGAKREVVEADNQELKLAKDKVEEEDEEELPPVGVVAKGRA